VPIRNIAKQPLPAHTGWLVQLEQKHLNHHPGRFAATPPGQEGQWHSGPSHVSQGSLTIISFDVTGFGKGNVLALLHYGTWRSNEWTTSASSSMTSQAP